jgi:hypothetical protein
VRKYYPVLVVGMTILLMVAAASCSSGSSGSPSPAPMYSTKDATTVTARELFTAYSTHKAASDKLYKGKLLDVTGVIHDVGTDPLLNNAPEIVLSGGLMNQAPGVDCTFDQRYASEVATLKPGQTTSVLGICDGFAVNVVLLHGQPAKS